LSDDRLPMATLDIRDLSSIDRRILVHGEEEASGRSYLMLEGTDGQDMGDSEAILRNKAHLRETAREMIRRGVYPQDGGRRDTGITNANRQLR
jgi:hypothetical protein